MSRTEWPLANLRLTNGNWFTVQGLRMRPGGFTFERAWGRRRLSDPELLESDLCCLPSRRIEEIREVKGLTGSAR